MLRRMLTAGLLGIAAIGVNLMAGIGPAVADSTHGDVTRDAPLPTNSMMGYWRTWGDQAAGVEPDATARMDEIPESVRMVMVFTDFTPPDNPFWETLKNDYVPAMHAKGQRVVHTINVDQVTDPAYPNTPAGHAELAASLVEGIVDEYGIDGLDLDVESELVGADLERATGVMKELRRQLGSERLLILDTNQDGDNQLFRTIADDIDYLLLQTYGRTTETLDGNWQTFAPYITPDRFAVSFAIEGGEGWGDLSDPIAESLAAEKARWQPADGTKGGYFSYGLDIDGNDGYPLTNYLVSQLEE